MKHLFFAGGCFAELTEEKQENLIEKQAHLWTDRKLAGVDST